jgi:hypothetical protein
LVIYQVFLLSPLQQLKIKGCVGLEKFKSQGKAVEVTVNRKEENFKGEIGQQIGIIRLWGLVCIYFFIFNVA